MDATLQRNGRSFVGPGACPTSERPARLPVGLRYRLPGGDDDRMVRASLRRRRADVRLRLPRPRGPARRAGPRHADHPGLDGYTRKGPRGAQRFQWNAETKTLQASWLYTERSMAWTLSPVSSTDQTIYLNTLQDGR
jgi:hypothetical protein